jgi:ABC-type antimicrobial peptide transport system permease subunit
MDLRAVFLRLEDAQDFFGLGDGVHQIVVRLPEGEDELSGPLAAVRGALDPATLEALGWNEIVPELERMMEDKRQGQQAISFVVFVIVALGVLNTATMSTFERTREFGVLASLGTRPRRILGLVLTESVLLGVLSVALGVGFASALLYGIGELDLSAFGQDDVMGVRMPSSVPLTLQWQAVQRAFTVGLATVVLGTLIPAIRAARLRPAEAARFV